MVMRQDKLAFDYQSARVFDVDGHLHVAQTNISKAMVCPYYGHEIPRAADLGLEPDRIYHLLRDPSELAKSAASFNGKPLLLGHVPVSAQDHDHQRTVGSISNVRWVPPYLKADLSCWTDMAIDSIQDATIKELSASYRYVPDMQPGTFQGVRYDGIMRGLVGNHVALVERGRAGSDVAVCDSAIQGAADLSEYATYDDLANILAKYGISTDTIREANEQIAADTAQTLGENEMSMSPLEVETILNFLVSKLPEDQLADLDATLAGENGAEGRTDALAQDSRARERQSWLAMDARARHRARKARTGAAEQRAADAASFAERFPNMGRLSGSGY